MDYREYAVPRALQRHIRCVWHLRDLAPSQAAQTLYPDGHCELIVHRGHPMRAFHPEQGWHQQTKSLFAAQHRSPVRLAAIGPLDCIGVRLQPAVSAALPETALPTLRDHIVDLATLNADFSDRFVTACTQAGDKDEALSALWALLDTALRPYRIDARIEAAIQRLQQAHGQCRIEPLAHQASMSARAFQMHFLQAVGLTAKEFARIQRLQATLRQLDASAQPLSALALEHGFADQAHATRELQYFTGLTPARLRQALQQQRDSDRTIALAAAFVRGHSRAGSEVSA